MRDFAHIRASLRTLNEADLFVVITLVTILAVGAIRRSMMDGVVSGIAVTVFGLIWLAFSHRKMMHGLFGIQTAIGKHWAAPASRLLHAEPNRGMGGRCGVCTSRRLPPDLTKCGLRWMAGQKAR